MENSFKIIPVAPVNELLKEAMHVMPPKETAPTGSFRKSELVDLAQINPSFDPSFQFDIRYATSNNFVGAVLYDLPKAFLQKPAAMALVRASKRLEAQGYGLIIYDGYRPWYVTWVFWQATPDEQKIFVADPKEGSKHNRGCAIDLGMYDRKTGKSVEFPSGFDEMTPRAFSDYAGGTKEQNHHRKVLRSAMEAEDFTVHPKEWWHFDYKDWMLYGIQNQKFDAV